MATETKNKLENIDFSNMSDEEKRKLILSMRRLRGRKGNQKRPAPTTDDELWDWIKAETGYEIPRVAVCDGHCAPFDYVADYYFERESALLVIGGRESAKTLNTAIANYTFAETKPGCEICTFADIEAQSNKSYSYIKSFVYTTDDTGKKVVKPTVEGVPLRKETLLKNGSKLEVIIGTLSGVNSPHPQKVHADEVDLQEREIFAESRNMSSSKTFPDGRVIKAQDIATSTLKSTKGVVQEIVDETEKAKKEGLKPTWKIYKACVFEVARENPACRTAPKDIREARLKELERDPCELCDCDKVAKGEWSERNPRTLDTVCKGKFFKSRGWMSHEDVIRKFVQNSPTKWASQLECRRPMADGLYLPTWSRERYVVKDYEPRPEYGYIWMGVDWGGSANSTSAVLWVQGPLHQPLQVNNFQGTKTLIPKGAYVIFKEINEAAIGATRLADKVVRQEIQYRNRFGGAWRVKGRFADKAGAQQRADWREHNPPLRTNWYLSGKYFDPTVECLQALVADSLLYADGAGCPGTCDDFESWRSVDGKEVHDQSSHNPAAARYCLKNVQGIVKRYQGNTRTTLQPLVAARSAADSVPGAISQVGVNSITSADYSSEAWRRSMGQQMPGEGNDGSRGGRPDWMP
jgi:hypothetical protein